MAKVRWRNGIVDRHPGSVSEVAAWFGVHGYEVERPYVAPVKVYNTPGEGRGVAVAEIVED